LTAAVFYGLAYGIILPSLNSIIVLLASRDRKGAAVAVYYGAIVVFCLISSAGFVQANRRPDLFHCFT